MLLVQSGQPRMRTLDRYVIREVLAPFALALLVLTFILIIPFIIDLAEQVIAKGVPAGTILLAAATLIPQALALTIGWPALQENAFWNSGMFCTVPLTR